MSCTNILDEQKYVNSYAKSLTGKKDLGGNPKFMLIVYAHLVWK